MEKEYDMLRAEIMQNLNLMHGLLSVLFTAVGLFFAFVFNNGDPKLFIIIFLVIVLIVNKICSLNYSNIRISTYMIVYLEPNMENRKWETRNYRSINNSAKSKNIVFKVSIADISYLLITAAVYIVFIVKLIENFNMLNLLIAGSINTFCLAYVLFISLNISRDTNNRESFINMWKHID